MHLIRKFMAKEIKKVLGREISYKDDLNKLKSLYAAVRKPNLPKPSKLAIELHNDGLLDIKYLTEVELDEVMQVETR